MIINSLCLCFLLDMCKTPVKVSSQWDSSDNRVLRFQKHTPSVWILLIIMNNWYLYLPTQPASMFVITMSLSHVTFLVCGWHITDCIVGWISLINCNIPLRLLICHFYNSPPVLSVSNILCPNFQYRVLHGFHDFIKSST